MTIMKRIGIKKVWFTGSRGYFERIVWKDERNDKYFVNWYHQKIEVIQCDGCEGVSQGWKTVEEY